MRCRFGFPIALVAVVLFVGCDNKKAAYTTVQSAPYDYEDSGVVDNGYTDAGGAVDPYAGDNDGVDVHYHAGNPYPTNDGYAANSYADNNNGVTIEYGNVDPGNYGSTNYGSTPATYNTGNVAPPVASYAATSAPAARGQIIHRVVKGDTLYALARTYYSGDDSQWRSIFEANRQTLRNPNSLRPGQELIIP